MVLLLCIDSYAPTTVPSINPSELPSAAPSVIPSSSSPSEVPSTVRTAGSSIAPTTVPIVKPSVFPTQGPLSAQPSQPFMHPSTQPSCQLTSQPSTLPSVQPTSKPSMHPTSRPSYQPSDQPSSQTSVQPGSYPNTQVDSYPTVVPSICDESVNPLLLFSSFFSLQADLSFSNELVEYEWSCVILTAKFFGQDCLGADGKLIFKMPSTNRVLEYNGLNLIKDVSYRFTLLVSTSDGRIHSSLTDLSMVDGDDGGGVLIQTIGSPFQAAKINVGDRVTISSAIASVALGNTQASWTTEVNGISVNIPSLTPLTRDVRFESILSMMLYPLVIGANTLDAGCTISFQLSAKASSSRITIVTNASPAGGSIVVNPTIGISFSTTFIMNSIDWSDDVGDYPLAYSFAQRSSAYSRSLIIQSHCNGSITTERVTTLIVTEGKWLTVEIREYCTS